MPENLQQRPSGYRDPRTALTQDKYFTLRPKPLERWIWQRGLAQAAERVFWVHWEEGMRAGDWCSQLSLRKVAQLCCVDPSTVTRAYQQLKAAGLIRREDAGRDPANPFQQATALTEVRLPRELLAELHLAPNRNPRHSRAQDLPMEVPQAAVAARAEPQTSAEIASEAPVPKISMREAMRIIGKLSATEKAVYDRAWADHLGAMGFDDDTRLSLDEQRVVLRQLQARARPAKPTGPAPGARAGQAPLRVGPRRLTPLEAARLRKRVGETVAGADVPELFRQIVWAVEEGALKRFETAKAVNIALKKLREGGWTRPHRMPPQWRLGGVPGRDSVAPFAAARPETCSAA